MRGCFENKSSFSSHPVVRVAPAWPRVRIAAGRGLDARARCPRLATRAHRRRLGARARRRRAAVFSLGDGE